MEEKRVMIVCAGRDHNELTRGIAYYYAGLLRSQKMEVKIFCASKLTNSDFQNICNRSKIYNRYVFIVSDYKGLFPKNLRKFIKVCFPNAFIRNQYAILVRIIFTKQEVGKEDMEDYSLEELIKLWGTKLHPIHLKVNYSEKEPMKSILSNETYLEILKNQVDFLKNV